MERNREAIISPQEYMAAPARGGASTSLLLFCSTEQRRLRRVRPGNNQGRVAAARPRGMFCAGVPGNCKRNQFNRSPPSEKMSIDQGSGLNSRPGSLVQRRARCASQTRPILQVSKSTTFRFRLIRCMFGGTPAWTSCNGAFLPNSSVRRGDDAAGLFRTPSQAVPSATRFRSHKTSHHIGAALLRVRGATKLQQHVSFTATLAGSV